MKKIQFLAICAATIMFTACNNGDTNNDSLSDTMDSMSITDNDSANRNDHEMAHNDDQKFIEDAVKGNMMEVEMGKIAVAKASNASVKSFAQQMVDDHGKANERLISIAQQHNVTVPTALESGERGDIDKMNEKTGADFDKDYVDRMVDDHKKDIDKYQKAIDDIQDSTLKKYAIETLPTLQKHYDEIKKIQDQIK